MSDENISVTKADLTAGLNPSGIRLIERVDKMETTLLGEFHRFAISFESGFRANESLVARLNERVTSLEERVSDIEQRQRPDS